MLPLCADLISTQLLVLPSELGVVCSCDRDDSASTAEEKTRLMSRSTAVESLWPGACLRQVVGLEHLVFLGLGNAHHHILALRHPNAEKLCFRKMAPLRLHRTDHNAMST